MRTSYVTDSFSTLGGLASVAYGDPEYFREVQNQIFAQSPTRFIDLQRPSDAFEGLVGSISGFIDLVMEVLEAEYKKSEGFTDYADVYLGPDWRVKIRSLFQEKFTLFLDSVSDYELTLSGYIGLVVNAIIPETVLAETLTTTITAGLVSDSIIGKDVAFFAKLVANNPQTKLSVPPPSTKVALNNSVDLGLDYRGVEIVSGYLSPQDYWGGIAYPGATATSSIPVNFRPSISQGYFGYLSSPLLENIYNPAGSISLRDSENETYALPQFGSSVINAFPRELQVDQEVYAISLIGEKLNGYTSFIPSQMSNGDLIDPALVTDFDRANSDSQGGLNPMARNFTPAF